MMKDFFTLLWAGWTVTLVVLMFGFAVLVLAVTGFSPLGWVAIAMLAGLGVGIRHGLRTARRQGRL